MQVLVSINHRLTVRLIETQMAELKPKSKPQNFSVRLTKPNFLEKSNRLIGFSVSRFDFLIFIFFTHPETYDVIKHSEGDLT